MRVTAAVPPAGTEASTNRATSLLRTLVLCDLVDSTALVEHMGDQRAAQLFRKHDRLARTLIQEYGGQEIDKTDGFLLMFDRPIQAVAFAIAYQRQLAALNSEEKSTLATRFGIHIGDVVVWDNEVDDVRRGAKRTEVEGLVKPVAARLMQLALPGQILLSGTAYDIAHRAQGELGEKLKSVRWRTHGRYRFKGVPDPVPVFEVGEEGIAPLKPPPWSGKAHREMPVWRRPLIVGLELAVLLAVIALPIWYLTRPTPAIAFAQRDWVVVGSLNNLTGDKAFEGALQSAFRIGLEQSRYVNVVPELQVRDALKRMERDPTAKVDRATGSEIALREGARALVLPTIAEIGGRVRLTAELIDPRTQTSVYSDSVDGNGEESVLPSMDDLLKKMRGRLGESMAAVSNASLPLAQITSGNLDALRAFGKAEEAFGRGQVNDALLLLKEALRLDPDFALAWNRLSTIQVMVLNDYKAAYASLQKAELHSQRLSAREKLFVDATLTQYMDAHKWVELWSVAAQLYPDAIAARQNLGLGYMWYEHRLKEARPNFAAVAASRHPWRGLSWYSLAMIETELGDDAKAMADIAQGRKLGTVAPHFEDVAPDLAQRRYAAVVHRLEDVSTHLPAALEAEKQLRYAAVALDQKQYDEAMRALGNAEKLSATTSSLAQQARLGLARVAIGAARGSRDTENQLRALIESEMRRAKDAEPTIDGSPSLHLALAAMLSARAGDARLARSALDAVRTQALDHGYYDRSALWHSADCEARFVDSPTQRIACLTPLLDGREYYQTHVALLRAYIEAKDAVPAAVQAQWLAAHRGQAVAELENETALIPNLVGAAYAEQWLHDHAATASAQ